MKYSWDEYGCDYLKTLQNSRLLILGEYAKLLKKGMHASYATI